MTREQTIQKIVDRLVAQGEERQYCEDAFRAPCPIWSCLMMLEALGLVKYDDDPSTS